MIHRKRKNKTIPKVEALGRALRGYSKARVIAKMHTGYFLFGLRGAHDYSFPARHPKRATYTVTTHWSRLKRAPHKHEQVIDYTTRTW